MTKEITAEEIDRMFDEGEDISEYVDWEHPVHDEIGDGPIRYRVSFTFDPQTYKALSDLAASKGQTRAEYLGRLIEREVAIA